MQDGFVGAGLLRLHGGFDGIKGVLKWKTYQCSTGTQDRRLKQNNPTIVVGVGAEGVHLRPEIV